VEIARASARVHALGQRQESEAALREATTKYAEIMPYQIALVHAYRGETDEASNGWTALMTFATREMAWFLRTDPFLANIRAIPVRGSAPQDEVAGRSQLK